MSPEENQEAVDEGCPSTASTEHVTIKMGDLGKMFPGSEDKCRGEKEDSRENPRSTEQRLSSAEYNEGGNDEITAPDDAGERENGRAAEATGGAEDVKQVNACNAKTGPTSVRRGCRVRVTLTIVGISACIAFVCVGVLLLTQVANKLPPGDVQDPQTGNIKQGDPDSWENMPDTTTMSPTTVSLSTSTNDKPKFDQTWLRIGPSNSFRFFPMVIRTTTTTPLAETTPMMGTTSFMRSIFLTKIMSAHFHSTGYSINDTLWMTTHPEVEEEFQTTGLYPATTVMSSFPKKDTSWLRLPMRIPEPGIPASQHTDTTPVSDTPTTTKGFPGKDSSWMRSPLQRPRPGIPDNPDRDTTPVSATPTTTKGFPIKDISWMRSPLRRPRPGPSNVQQDNHVTSTTAEATAP